MAIRQKKGIGAAAPMTAALFLKQAGIGAVFGVALTIVVLLLLAALMTVRDVPHTMVEPLAISAASVGSLFGGLVSSRLLGEKGLFAGLCTGAMVALLIVLLSLVSSGLSVGMMMMLRLITILLSSAVGGVLGVNIRKKRR